MEKAKIYRETNKARIAAYKKWYKAMKKAQRTALPLPKAMHK